MRRTPLTRPAPPPAPVPFRAFEEEPRPARRRRRVLTVLTYVLLAGAFRSLEGGADFAPVHAPARAGEVLRSCLDASRAHELLGWEPQVPLADGLALTLATISAPRAG